MASEVMRGILLEICHLFKIYSALLCSRLSLERQDRQCAYHVTLKRVAVTLPPWKSNITYPRESVRARG